MGVDVHGLRFLQYARARSNAFGEVATVGRQQIHIPGIFLENLRLQSKPRFGDFCEQLLLDDFQASSIVSFDASDYEGATYVADFNLPLVHNKAYDTVVDFGTTEHIFDVAQALRNIDSLCKEGGQILHMLPANNYCGHGFWQFSPELFFSLYSDRNGYSSTEVFVIKESDPETWYKVKIPDGHRRINLKSSFPIIVACRTIKLKQLSEKSVQQSDYVYIWKNESKTQATVPKKRKSFFRRWTKPIVKRWKLLLPSAKKTGKESLSVHNENLTVCNVEELIACA